MMLQPSITWQLRGLRAYFLHWLSWDANHSSYNAWIHFKFKGYKEYVTVNLSFNFRCHYTSFHWYYCRCRWWEFRWVDIPDTCYKLYITLTFIIASEAAIIVSIITALMMFTFVGICIVVVCSRWKRYKIVTVVHNS